MRDLLPQHLPVAAEVVGDVRPGLGRRQPPRHGRSRAGRVVLVAGRRRPARARAPGASRRGETNSRSSSAISAIITMPPRYSASVNCQPIRTHSTSPSSQTRFVEANWKASARRGRGALLEQRLGDRDRRVGARRRRGAERGRERDRPRAAARSEASMRSRGTHACTIAEIAKPRTSAHQTSQAIRSASTTPCQISPGRRALRSTIPLGGICSDDPWPRPPAATRPPRTSCSPAWRASRARSAAIERHGRGGPLLHRRAHPDRGVQAALDKVALGLLDDHAHHCVIAARPRPRPSARRRPTS